MDLRGALPPVRSPSGLAKAAVPSTSALQVNAGRRRALLSLLMATATIPEANDSRKALLLEYLRRSKENKLRNDKERLDDYYKRNYKDYFEFIEGSTKGKNEEELTESEKSIRDWLQKNKK